MEKCLIFNTDENYVRTKNFIRYTKGLFEHIVIKDNKKYLSKIYKLYKLRKKGLLDSWIYAPNFDPILVFICRLFNVKIISDILETHTEMHSDLKFKKLIYNLIERFSVNNSTIAIAVTEEETENLEKKYCAKNVITIKNFPDLDDFKPRQKKFRKFSVAYFGVCMPSRDLTNATKAIKKLQEKCGIEMHIIGDEKLKSQIFCDYKYHGWLNHDEASEIIGRCHLGISPYENNRHCNLTLQNKAFQYAACNVLPLSTNLKPLHKYKELVKLTDNSIDGWYKEIKRYYALWKNGKIRFNQREVLERNKWTAENEWIKLKKIIKEAEK